MQSPNAQLLNCYKQVTIKLKCHSHGCLYLSFFYLIVLLIYLFFAELQCRIVLKAATMKRSQLLIVYSDINLMYQKISLCHSALQHCTVITQTVKSH